MQLLSLACSFLKTSLSIKQYSACWFRTTEGDRCTSQLLCTLIYKNWKGVFTNYISGDEHNIAHKITNLQNMIYTHTFFKMLAFQCCLNHIFGYIPLGWFLRTIQKWHHIITVYSTFFCDYLVLPYLPIILCIKDKGNSKVRRVLLT